MSRGLSSKRTDEHETDEHDMTDVLMVLAAVVFFALSFAMVRWFDKI
jgi:hypothetical protein